MGGIIEDSSHNGTSSHTNDDAKLMAAKCAACRTEFYAPQQQIRDSYAVIRDGRVRMSDHVGIAVRTDRN
jgi:hypothetical protein